MTDLVAEQKLLDQDFAFKPELKFTEDSHGLQFIEIDNTLATAKIALQGAHVMQWQPKSPGNLPHAQGLSPQCR